ncbi:hypothetical protein AZE42_07343 [Rhizopogon vesiculosus]|uniref:Uncharacterized protein n=1 Tax=Rhizopogon vesiculosus TaxID=180088 RepID=A0A1J8QAL4_9AGAM|nr:hypothetical protein AZE42_07343 [Rhizopogon vesiculosus]
MAYLLRQFTVDLIIDGELLVIDILVSTSLLPSFSSFIAALPFNLDLFTGSLIFMLTLFLALPRPFLDPGKSPTPELSEWFGIYHAWGGDQIVEYENDTDVSDRASGIKSAKLLMVPRTSATHQ